MTSVVVDASVLIACAISDGRTRRTYFSAQDIEFYAPRFVLEELRRRDPKVLALAAVPLPVLTSLLEDLFERLTIVLREAFAHRLVEARQFVARVGAKGDEDYVALALALDAPIWTYDKDFSRIGEVRVVNLEQVLSGKAR